LPHSCDLRKPARPKAEQTEPTPRRGPTANGPAQIYWPALNALGRNASATAQQPPRHRSWPGPRPNWAAQARFPVPAPSTVAPPFLTAAPRIVVIKSYESTAGATVTLVNLSSGFFAVLAIFGLLSNILDWGYRSGSCLYSPLSDLGRTDLPLHMVECGVIPDEF